MNFLFRISCLASFWLIGSAAQITATENLPSLALIGDKESADFIALLTAELTDLKQLDLTERVQQNLIVFRKPRQTALDIDYLKLVATRLMSQEKRAI